MPSLIETWSNDAAEENNMTEEHAWIWREMLRAIALPDLRNASVLDIGCNQGGFLRLLYDTRPVAQGTGVDLARDRVAMANDAIGDRPLNYLATAELSEAGSGFDLAFSHEVVYLIDDLAEHAQQVSSVLKPGGCYDAVTCCHADNPLYATWRPMIENMSNIPVPDHSVSDIAAAFRGAGLDVSVSRFLASSFIPMESPGTFMPTDTDRLETYTRWKLCFRCVKPY